jgi:hypothetical protein
MAASNVRTFDKRRGMATAYVAGCLIVFVAYCLLCNAVYPIPGRLQHRDLYDTSIMNGKYFIWQGRGSKTRYIAISKQEYDNFASIERAKAAFVGFWVVLTLGAGLLYRSTATQESKAGG